MSVLREMQTVLGTKSTITKTLLEDMDAWLLKHDKQGWAKLSPEFQAWYHAAHDVVEANEQFGTTDPIPPPPGSEPETAEPETAEPVAEAPQATYGQDQAPPPDPVSEP